MRIITLHGMANAELHVADGAYTALHINGARVRVLTPFEEEFVRSCLAAREEYAEELLIAWHTSIDAFREAFRDSADYDDQHGGAWVINDSAFESACRKMDEGYNAALAKNPTQPAKATGQSEKSSHDAEPHEGSDSGPVGLGSDAIEAECQRILAMTDEEVRAAAEAEGINIEANAARWRGFIDGYQKGLARGGNYVADREVNPTKITFANGRTVELVGGILGGILVVGRTSQLPSQGKDTARLDWLDKMNAALNAHYGTVYKWELILSPNVTRLFCGPSGNGYIAAIDLQDAQANGAVSCRAAIDKAMVATALPSHSSAEPKA